MDSETLPLEIPGSRHGVFSLLCTPNLKPSPLSLPLCPWVRRTVGLPRTSQGHQLGDKRMSLAIPKQKASCHVPISVTSWSLGSDYLPLKDHCSSLRLSSQSQDVLGQPTILPAGCYFSHLLSTTDLLPTPHGCLSTLISLGHRFYSFITADLKYPGIFGF